MNKKIHIFVTNDDGISAKGLAALTEMVRPFGALTVVAPKEPQSGMSGAMTIGTPLRLYEHSREEGLERYVCTGTPVDCVKIGLSQFFSEQKPDLLVSGINHGANTSAAVFYSGTLGATGEGILYGVPSIGFSLSTPHNPDANFDSCIVYGRKILEQYLIHPPSPDVFINVNFPDIPNDQIKGIRFARQGKGAWIKEFEKRRDPHGYDYYWLTGEFRNDEPEALDADHNLVNLGYVSIVPHQFDTTCYPEVERLGNVWKFL
ncbi:MAG: 5'/3'-nucleotidase SurE [Prevotellaceae bacterium]|nr:5'/3'-nucleotidase SurE [Prevotellaceae bacterium]